MNSKMLVRNTDTLSLKRESSVTMLMVDIVDSTPFFTGLTPNGIRSAFNSYYSVCNSAARQFGGRTVRYIGDGVTCLFQGRKSNTLNVINAVDAAVRIHSDFSCIQPTSVAHANGFYSLKLRISIASGLCVLDEYPLSESGAQEIVYGQVPFLVNRLNKMVKPGGTILCEKSAKLIASERRVSPMKCIRPRGFSGDYQPYTLIENYLH